LTDEFPSFDDDWVAAAQHREASVAELDAMLRAERRRQRRDRRRRRIRSAVGITVVLGIVAGFAWYVVAANQRRNSFAVDVGGGVRLGGVLDARPTPQPGSHRLLPAVTAANPTASHAFLSTRDDGTPVRYDPCRPVRFVVNPENAPSDYLAIIDDVLGAASAASGLQLELVDTTTEPPTVDRAPYRPDLYGSDDWAPILIAWTDETVIPELAGAVGGIGGSTWISSDDSDDGWYVSGTLYVDREGGDDPERNTVVMIHEIGHVLGLGHVDDDSQAMYGASTVSAYGDGDLAGLAAVGAGDCATGV